MDAIVVGDMHLGRKIRYLVPNPYASTLTIDKVHQRWTGSIIEHVHCNLLPYAKSLFSDKPLFWIFLGDIIEFPSIPITPFKQLVDDILNGGQQWGVHVLVGNHDTRKVGVLDATSLKELSGYRNRVKIHATPSVYRLNGQLGVFLPYLKRRDFIPCLSKIRENIRDPGVPVIFSHNNLYLTDAFLETAMFSKEEVDRVFGESVIFNGHIHRSHYEMDYYQVGSVGPTSFKEEPHGSGSCVYTDGRVKVFRNNKLFLLSVASGDYLGKLVEILTEAREKDVTVFLKVGRLVHEKTQSILRDFTDVVPGVVWASGKT